jgi:hypothetical protein
MSIQIVRPPRTTRNPSSSAERRIQRLRPSNPDPRVPALARSQLRAEFGGLIAAEFDRLRKVEPAMTGTTRTAIALLLVAQGLVACDNGNRLPLSPSIVPQVTQGPPANPGTYTLTPSVTTVAPGAVLSVSWTASTGGSSDWIGLFTVGAASCDHGWSEYTGGGTSGTFTLTAPTRPGQYEFRYLPNDGCGVTARSSPVTVTTAD